MRILALASSHRKQGNTARIVKMTVQHLEALAAAEGEPLEIETLHLAHMDIQPCRGCRVCFDRGESACPLKDDIPMIAAKVRAADGIILAAPVYVNDVNGVMKTWIDRLAYVCHRPAFAGKSALLLATTGSSPVNHSMRTMQTPLTTWGISIAGQAGFKTGALMDQKELEHRFHEKTLASAQKLYNAVRSQQSNKPSFLSLMTFKIQQLGWKTRPQDSLDHRYWQSQGWLDRQCQFFIPHRTGRLKVALARLSGALIARFMI